MVGPREELKSAARLAWGRSNLVTVAGADNDSWLEIGFE